MTKPDHPRAPLARSVQIIVKQLPDELLVYDLERSKAHCLNQSAAAIWKLCDGRSSPEQITKKLQRQTGQPVSEEFVWHALAQLDRDHLLAERLTFPEGVSRISRREAVRRIALGAAIALPLVVSLTSPTPAQAATCRARGQACSTSVQCCSNFCRSTGVCA
jgi:hypothetical protein